MVSTYSSGCALLTSAGRSQVAAALQGQGTLGGQKLNVVH